MEVTWVPIIGLMGGALGSSEGGAVFPGGPYKRVLEVSNIIIRNFAPPNLYGSPEDPFFDFRLGFSIRRRNRPPYKFPAGPYKFFTFLGFEDTLT